MYAVIFQNIWVLIDEKRIISTFDLSLVILVCPLRNFHYLKIRLRCNCLI